MRAQHPVHEACREKTLHALTHRLEAQHGPMLEELSLVVRLAEAELARHGRRHPTLLPDLHLSLSVLRDAVAAHFEREEALLFPNARLLEDGVPYTLSLTALLPEVLWAHRQIGDQLIELRRLTGGFTAPSCTPLLRALYVGMLDVTRKLSDRMRVEEQQLFPQLLAFQPSAGARA